ncbi:hypothetical protein [Trichlorobacter lovleyi]|uniref:Uncharacterized protein n=1 Tax=Trichlorobacter lovleyi (strain ATCC BAA-1151 / DSM 17278 / SZ) TaxID=398767 RepID=B3E5M0_TRIL1|nr:hypothetical protein [Trichlorobacter lovleyi]ACD94691.1 hypothetical protein Glov_0968 [Trichlorobacter lovleyi SZ]
MTRQTRSNGVNNNKGIALLSLVALTALIPLIILLLLSLNTSQASHARYYNSADTVLKMKEIKNFLMNQSRDIDDDGKYEPPAVGTGNTLPAGSYNAKDAWGHDYSYCAWDLGTQNSTDTIHFSNNNIAPPDSYNNLNTSLLTGRIVSVGPDGIFNGITGETPCNATTARGDDIFVEFTQAEIGQVPGWRREAPTGTETTNKIKLITKADTVVVGESPATPPTTPTVKMDVQGGVLKATDGLVIQTTTVDPQNPINGQIWLLQ